MVTEIEARVLLSRVRQPDSWFGLSYNMNVYRGCPHACIYCDTRSECYDVGDLSHIRVKVNAVDRLRDELPRKRLRGTIGTGSMSDPYQPLEAERNLTGRALAVIAEHRFPVHVYTKSGLVTRDIPVLRRIARVYAAISFSVTTTDDALAAKLEPGATPPSGRFRAMKQLADSGILTGVIMMPVLPFITDTGESVAAIVDRARDAGASYIVPCFSMTMRDHQRDYYYRQLDRLFPGLRAEYERRFGDRYVCPARDAGRLERVFRTRCAEHGIATRMPVFDTGVREQTGMF